MVWCLVGINECSLIWIALNQCIKTEIRCQRKYVSRASRDYYFFVFFLILIIIFYYFCLFIIVIIIIINSSRAAATGAGVVVYTTNSQIDIKRLEIYSTTLLCLRKPQRMIYELENRHRKSSMLSMAVTSASQF